MRQTDLSPNHTAPSLKGMFNLGPLSSHRASQSKSSQSCRSKSRGRINSKTTRSIHGRRRQGGWSIVEFMIAGFLSMVVSGSAIGVLSNALGSNTKIMQRIQLSHNLRTSMQMMSRDVRRAGYSAGSMWCLANTACLPNVNINLPIDAGLPLLASIDIPGGIQISEDNSCFSFELDRNHDGTVSADEHGAYRRRTVSGVGVIETWLGAGAPDCSSSNTGWSAVTVPTQIDINSFQVDDDLSIEQQVSTDLLGNTTTQKIRRIRLQLQGRLVIDPDMTEQLQDVVDVRNDLLL